MLEAVGNFAQHAKEPAAAGALAHARRLQHGAQTERTTFFSDAVFAIAMTLLALDLKLPELPADITRHGFDQVLLGRVPSLAAFVLSFVLVGRLWLTHHRRFSAIMAYDGKLQVGNLWLLFFVVFLPVPTSMLFREAADSPWPPILYAVTVAGLMLAGSWTWHHAWKAGLLHDWVDAPLCRLVLHGTDPVWAIFVLSIPVAFLDPVWAMYGWILIWPVSVVHGKWRMRQFVSAMNEGNDVARVID